MEARTPIRMPRDERRRQIVRIAGELFAERGYHGASMSELARRAGISKPVIYDLVGSKEDVYRASCEEVAMEVGVALMTAVSSTGCAAPARSTRHPTRTRSVRSS